MMKHEDIQDDMYLKQVVPNEVNNDDVKIMFSDNSCSGLHTRVCRLFSSVVEMFLFLYKIY